MAKLENTGKSEVSSTIQGLTQEIGFGGIIGQSRGILSVIKQARRCACLPTVALLIGENGTGKELVAKAIHYCGFRAAGPFVEQNCAAVPADLFEDTFFGNIAGAFTGARGRAGLFEQANGGTPLLDEISSLAPR